MYIYIFCDEIGWVWCTAQLSSLQGDFTHGLQQKDMLSTPFLSHPILSSLLSMRCLYTRVRDWGMTMGMTTLSTTGSVPYQPGYTTPWYPSTQLLTYFTTLPLITLQQMHLPLISRSTYKTKSKNTQPMLKHYSDVPKTLRL